MELVFTSIDETMDFARLLGSRLKGGEVLELIGDVGAGKTTFTKGLGVGLGVDDDIQSPSFTISRTYEARDGLTLHHYDFYRLPDPGIMQYYLEEAVGDPKAVTVIEWAQTVSDMLPTNRVVLQFTSGNNEERRVTLLSKVSGVEEAYATWNKN